MSKQKAQTVAKFVRLDAEMVKVITEEQSRMRAETGLLASRQQAARVLILRGAVAAR